jgi:hypothetical protein
MRNRTRPGSLKIAGKKFHHRDRESRRKTQAMRPVFCGAGSVFPGVLESTEVSEATENQTHGLRGSAVRKEISNILCGLPNLCGLSIPRENDSVYDLLVASFLLSVSVPLWWKSYRAEARHAH